MDLVFITSDIKQVEPIYSEINLREKPPTNIINDCQIDIWDYTDRSRGLEVNYIFWSRAFFERIVSYVGLDSLFARRYSRRMPNPKSFFNFDHDCITHTYSPIILSDGMIIDFPVHLLKGNRYWAGIPVEQLFSVPRILTCNGKWPERGLENLVGCLLERASREGREVTDLKELLLRKSKFSEESNSAFDSLVRRVLARQGEKIDVSF